MVPARAFATQETGMTQPTIGYHASQEQFAPEELLVRVEGVAVVLAGLFVPGPHIVLDDGDIGSISVLTGWSDQM